MFEFLELPWPQYELLDIIEEYLDEVEEATETVDRYHCARWQRQGHKSG